MSNMIVKQSELLHAQRVIQLCRKENLEQVRAYLTSCDSEHEDDEWDEIVMYTVKVVDAAIRSSRYLGIQSILWKLFIKLDKIHEKPGKDSPRCAPIIKALYPQVFKNYGDPVTIAYDKYEEKFLP